ncbi:hypothetical protein SDC9_141598 [bioreactor metagenome]|uniref:Uncharacterized protein n=1 Tax=bioreactor metagenome TaxID=1076179 RepID=A0A645E1I7_9ZZZZ
MGDNAAAVADDKGGAVGAYLDGGHQVAEVAGVQKGHRHTGHAGAPDAVLPDGRGHG